jgi:hypothetical protein
VASVDLSNLDRGVAYADSSEQDECQRDKGHCPSDCVSGSVLEPQRMVGSQSPPCFELTVWLLGGLDSRLRSA